MNTIFYLKKVRIVKISYDMCSGGSIISRPRLPNRNEKWCNWKEILLMDES